MLSNSDKAEIMRMIKNYRDETRKEIWERADDDKLGRDSLKDDVTDVENAVCDFDESMESRIADVENALCELDEE